MASQQLVSTDAAFERAVLCVFQALPSATPLDQQTAQAQLDDLASRPVALFDTCMVHLELSQRMEVQFYALQAMHGLVQSGGYAALDDGRKRALKRSLLQRGSSAAGSSQASQAAQASQASQLSQASQASQPSQASQASQSPPPLFMRNKLAQVIVAIAAEEYPAAWPGFFSDVLSALKENPASVDCFSRIMISIHEDIISLEVPRSAAGAKASMTFKDAMRDNALEQVAASWHQMLVMFKSSDPGLVALLLNSVERYVNWIDISLVANERFMPILFEVLNSDHSTHGVAQVAAVEVLAEIVGKKMESGVKLSLIQGLGLVPLAAQWADTGLPGMMSCVSFEVEDHDLAVASAKLLVNLANEILDAWKKVENSVISLQTVGVSLDDEAILEATASCQTATMMMEQLFPAVVTAFRIPQDDVSVIVAPFMLSYVSRIKLVSKRANGELAPVVRAQLVALLEAAAVCARFDSNVALYPVDYASMEEMVIAEEEEQSVSSRRQDLFSLFRNASKLVPAAAYELVVNMLNNSLIGNGAASPAGAVGAVGGATRASQGTSNWQDAEIALSLFYQLGEGMTEEVLKSSAHPLVELASGIIQLDDSVATHRLVALALLEACARYAKVTLFRPALLPSLASKFFGSAGLGHPASTVPPRAAYLLCRTVKILRQPISAISRDILCALMPHLDAIARSPIDNQSVYAKLGCSRPSGLAAAGASATVGVSGAGVSTPDDRLFAFEAAGLLVGSSEDEKIQVEWLQALTRPLIEQLERTDGNGVTSSEPSVSSTAADKQMSEQRIQSGNDQNGQYQAALCRQCMEALTRISKGFASKMCASRPKLTQALLQPLEPAVKAVKALYMVKEFRAKFLAYVHRLVECLGEPIVPLLPTVFWALDHPQMDASDFKDILVLVNQIVVRFTSNQTIIDSVVIPLFADCSSKVHEYLGSDWDWSMRTSLEGVEDQGTGSTEELRERAELQKQYYTIVNSVSQCTPVIDRVLSRDSAAVSDVFQGAVLNMDPAVRRLCIATLSGIVLHWVRTQPLVEVKEVVSRFGCDVLVFGLLVKPEAGGIDIRDAGSIALLSEIATQVKLLATNDRVGDVFLSAVVETATTRYGWNQEIAGELVAQIRTLDGRALRSYLKSMVVVGRERLR